MLSQTDFNGQAPRPDRVLEASLMPVCQKDSILYQLDLFLFNEGYDGSLSGVDGIVARLCQYIAEKRANLRYELDRTIDKVGILRSDVAEITALLKRGDA